MSIVSSLKFQKNVQFLSVILKKAFQDHYNQKNIMLPSRTEMCSWDLKLQWQVSEISSWRTTSYPSWVKDIHKIRIQATF